MQLPAPVLLAHVRGEGRREAVVVEGGRAQLAGEVEQLLHRLVREGLRLGQLGAELGRRLRARGLEAQEQAPVSAWFTSS